MGCLHARVRRKSAFDDDIHRTRDEQVFARVQLSVASEASGTFALWDVADDETDGSAFVVKRNRRRGHVWRGVG